MPAGAARADLATSRSPVRPRRTAKANAIVSSRRGQLLGFDTREGWNGWDVVRALMPEAEIGNLIIEVRSATAGVGSFTARFDHMAELSGRTGRPDHRGPQGRRRRVDLSAPRFAVVMPRESGAPQ